LTSFSGATTPTQPAEPEDFDSSWNDTTNNWGTDDDPFAPKANEDTTETNTKGEPDFTAWLSSQTKTAKKPLPKGLTKSGTASAQPKTVIRPKPTTTAAAAPKKIVSAVKPVVKKIVKKEAKPEEEEWGDDNW